MIFHFNYYLLTRGSEMVSVPAVPERLLVHLVVRLATAEAVSF